MSSHVSLPQSRFLANHPSRNSPTSDTTSPTASWPKPTTSSGRPRALSSLKLHPTTATDDKSAAKSSTVESFHGNNTSFMRHHPLRTTWVFWFRQQRAPGDKITSYEEGIKKISTFATVESFWSIWTHLSPPSALLPTTDYLLFHSGVRRPVWEDPLNITGGKWIIRLKKGVADRLWEDIVLAIIGDQFDECSPPSSQTRTHLRNKESTSEDWPGICGCTISVRQSEDIISVWNRHEADQKVRDKIRDTIRQVLNLPPSTIMEYKTNNDSMQDKSSFRTTPLDRS